jgi:hypothetical protein
MNASYYGGAALIGATKKPDRIDLSGETGHYSTTTEKVNTYLVVFVNIQKICLYKVIFMALASHPGLDPGSTPGYGASSSIFAASMKSLSNRPSILNVQSSIMTCL